MPYIPTDMLYVTLFLPALILSMWAQFRVKGCFRKYSAKPTASGVTGAEAARLILRGAGVGDVRIDAARGELTDHFDPKERAIRLSEGVHGRASVAAVGVAAHEAGHAIQYAKGY
ncbi:MAG: zinc metallopeptidase, partial [Oscillospiraceae bacterium]|nr:zinc metallopeptidase [Oscillospiraceae bacterium]